MTTETVPRQSTPWTPGVDSFGARLALVRQRMGWGNVAEAATACGLPTASWRNWERDGREPRRLTTIAKQISSVTGCSYRWLALGPDGDTAGYPDGPTRVLIRPDVARVVATVNPQAQPTHTQQRGHATRTTRRPAMARPLTPVGAR